MTIRLRLLLSFLLLIVPAFYYFIDFALNNVRPRYLETVEESMNDTANILASVAELDLAGDRPRPERMRAIFRRAQERSFEARIYDFTKRRMDLRAYMTDQRGVVLFDSGGQWEGLDFSRWNDVHLALQGRYGARSTRTDPKDGESGAYYVAAGVRDEQGRVRGVVSVAKDKQTLAPFIEQARRKLLEAGLTSAGAVIVLLVFVTVWITRPIARLHRYVDDVRRHKSVRLPHLGRTEIGTLGRAFEEMRLELEGKRYVESYVQTFTHELKSPLSGLLAATELLEGELGPQERGRFVATVRREAERVQELVERMLKLAVLENRREPLAVSTLQSSGILEEVAEQALSAAERKGVRLDRVPSPDAAFQGEEFLVRQALSNLISNAIDFCPGGGSVRLATEIDDKTILFRVDDDGPGIPDFAMERIFDRFYSLPRPDGRRSTGLGLAFVREAAALHGGSVAARNRPEGGASFELRLPL